MDVAWRRSNLVVALAAVGAIGLALAGCGGRRGGGGFVVDSGAPRSDAAMPMTDAGIVPRTDGGAMPMMDAGTVPRPDAGPPRPDAGTVVRPDAGPPRPDSGIVTRPDSGGLPPLPDGGGLGMCTSTAECAPGNECCMLFPGLGFCLPTGSCPAP